MMLHYDLAVLSRSGSFPAVFHVASRMVLGRGVKLVSVLSEGEARIYISTSLDRVLNKCRKGIK